MQNIIAGFILGILGSVHCVGMCGPLALAIPLPSNGSRSAKIMVYYTGKTMAYICLGILVSTLGLGFRIFQAQQLFSVIIGILLLIYLYFYFIIKKPISIQMPYQKKVQNLMTRWLGAKDSAYKFMFLGFLNGLLPCGLVYIALGSAALSGSYFQSSMVMLGFGLGTSPALIAIMAFKQQIKLNRRLKLAMPVLVAITSVLMILRGLNLGIPYLSPTYSAQKGEVENCCKK
jgi:hypothetical protein